MANNLSLKLIIDGTAAGALKALGQVQSGTAGVESQLKRLQDAGRNALQFAGVGLGISELIQLADTYTQMTSRLKLVTQYTGDYNTVFGALVDSARSTRSELPGTVDLFTKISPALRGIGLNGQQSVGVITTINKAMGVSGASAQSASAALYQLSQDLGAGALRGEGFNSVMEQTPSLVQYMADGLGVPIGEMRKLAEEGKLTTEALTGALQKMEKQIDADFAKIPLTVSKALASLRNEFLLFVGATDQASGGSSTLANVIGAVAQEFKEAGPVVTAFSEGIKIMINGFDGLYRMIKIVGLGLAGYAAAAQAALTGDFAGAKAIWRDLGKDIEDVLMKPLLAGPKVAESAADIARRRGLLEEQLKTQVEKLEAQKLYIATGSLDKIAAKEKEAIDKRIADQQRLVDAVRNAWQAAIKEAESATEKAQALRDKAAEKKTVAGDKATQIREKDLSPEDKQFLDAQRAQEAIDKGTFAAARAAGAQLEGRGKDFEKYAKEADSFLERALKFAEAAGDANLVDDIGARQAALLNSQAAGEEKKAADLKAQAESQAALLNQLQAQLEKMKTDARALEVKVEVADAETKIKGLQGQLDALPASKTVTVTVNTVNGGSAAAPAAPADVPGFEGGGFTGWLGTKKIAGVVHGREYVTPANVTMQPGVLPFLEALRRRGNKVLPGYELGGFVGSAIDRLSIPSLPSGAGSSAGKNLTLVLDGQRYQAGASNDTIDRLTSFVSREALRKGGRR